MTGTNCEEITKPNPAIRNVCLFTVIISKSGFPQEEYQILLKSHADGKVFSNEQYIKKQCLHNSAWKKDILMKKLSDIRK